LVDRVGEVVGLHHIVLLVAAKTVLRPERRGELEPGRGERVEAMRQVPRDRRRMREKRDAPAFERPAELGIGEEPIDAE
jgi:hypothetical protein